MDSQYLQKAILLTVTVYCNKMICIKIIQGRGIWKRIQESSKDGPYSCPLPVGAHTAYFSQQLCATVCMEYCQQESEPWCLEFLLGLCHIEMVDCPHDWVGFPAPPEVESLQSFQLLQGPTLNHIVSIDYVCGLMAPGKKKTLSSGRNFQGLWDYLPGADYKSTVSFGKVNPFLHNITYFHS